MKAKLKEIELHIGNLEAKIARLEDEVRRLKVKKDPPVVIDSKFNSKSLKS